MKKGNTQDGTVDFALPRTSASDLRGKQSVRATFKLSEKAIGALSIVSIHLGIKQKSLFDHLMEDLEALQQIADSVRPGDFKRQASIQKTYVLSRKTLSSLEKVSKSFNAPRDALVEYSIQRLLPVIVKEKERHLKRKVILGDLADYLADGAKLLEKTRALLGEDDPFFDRIQAAVASGESVYEALNAFVERGKVIEEF